MSLFTRGSSSYISISYLPITSESKEYYIEYSIAFSIWLTLSWISWSYYFLKNKSNCLADKKLNSIYSFLCWITMLSLASWMIFKSFFFALASFFSFNLCFLFAIIAASSIYGRIYANSIFKYSKTVKVFSTSGSRCICSIGIISLGFDKPKSISLSSELYKNVWIFKTGSRKTWRYWNFFKKNGFKIS